MGVNESDIDRYLSGSMTKDDPAWGEVSAFLESLDSAYPVESVAAFEDRHVPALAREARLIAGGHDQGKRRTMKDIFTFRTHRALIATIAAALLALTAGVGVASALGVNPLAHLAPASDPVVTPVPTVPTESAAPTPEPTDDDQADEPGDDEDASPTASPTRTHESEVADDSDEGDDSSDKADDGKSDSGDNEDADSSDGDKAGSDDGDDESGDSADESGDSADKGGDSGDKGDSDGGEDGGSDNGGDNG